MDYRVLSTRCTATGCQLEMMVPDDGTLVIVQVNPKHRNPRHVVDIPYVSVQSESDRNMFLTSVGERYAYYREKYKAYFTPKADELLTIASLMEK